jgi:rhodanese-related sulfurtransferase
VRSLLIPAILAAALGPLIVACGPAAEPEAGDASTNTGAVVEEAPPADDGASEAPADEASDDGAEAPAPSGDLPPVPAELTDAFKVDDEDPFVTTAELETAMASGMDLQFIDARPALDYEFGHVPGAINVEYSTAADYDASQLPTDRWMVVYCECPYAEARQTYDALRAQGVQNVRVLEEGLAGWRDVLGRDLEQSSPASEG